MLAQDLTPIPDVAILTQQLVRYTPFFLPEKWMSQLSEVSQELSRTAPYR
jgi:hypothetical protein